jgi:hypothetical protein
MIPTDQLAQLAAAAYCQTSTENRIQPPASWTLLRSNACLGEEYLGQQLAKSPQRKSVGGRSIGTRG